MQLLTDSDIVHRTRRARYWSGRCDGREVPAYIEEPGVDARRRTETYAEIELEPDDLRWAGTKFRLRSGKALGADRKEVAVRFRPVPHLPLGHDEDVRPDVLRFGLEPESMSFDVTATGSRAETFTQLALTARMDAPELPAYGRLLLNVLRGDPALSIRGDEAEEAWRVLDPVLSAWERDLVPLEEYPAGSAGPPPRLASPELREDLLHEGIVMPPRLEAESAERLTAARPRRQPRTERPGHQAAPDDVVARRRRVIPIPRPTPCPGS
ncbi:hypothetical protein [Streptomyces sp. RB17]|uniref:hypothetical protein n=1 Tax=Streptomyces sp. RB17 TaxID=2585197 RepID=UPI002B1EAEA5|nr:hypothetical protein [Streptomyces sp. RB17]